MKRIIIAALAVLTMVVSCSNTKNHLLVESKLPYGAPMFDKIRNSDYFPAFEQGIREAKADIDRIVANPDAPTFENTIEALEYSGVTLEKVSSIFYNLMEADTNPEMQDIAEKVSPMMTEYSLYVSLNAKLFERVKYVYDRRDSLGLEGDRRRILEKTYRGFVRNGANLSDTDKEAYGKYSEELSLLELRFGKNLLAATNAYTLDISDEAALDGLPDYVREMGRQTAADKGREGWSFDLSYPSMSAFMKFSRRRDLREELYMHYNTRAVGGEFDNRAICAEIVSLRTKIANLLGYETFADYAVEDRMLKSVANVYKFLGELREPTLPVARREVADVYRYACEHGFDDSALRSWDFSYWSERYRKELYDLDDGQLKPYFRLEDCIDAVFGLATTLYGLRFEERSDIPVYNKDVKVYDVKDADGRHLALYYVDFFPRESKRGGAWMTEFRGQSIRNGVEYRPFVSIVTNFSKPTAESPALLTHYELTTFLHEFGHSLHGMMAEGRYGSITGTNVDHDFVELPSQIMENWAYEPEFLRKFARHYKTGEVIPDSLMTRIVESKNYLSAYYQIRQLQFAYLDMAWYTLNEMPQTDTRTFEKEAIAPLAVLPDVPETCISTAFNHIFPGGYCAGYYSYKWAEVLEADAFSLFKEKGIFDTGVSHSFRENILSRGSSEDESVLYRNFRGHDPEPAALLVKLGITDGK